MSWPGLLLLFLKQHGHKSCLFLPSLRGSCRADEPNLLSTSHFGLVQGVAAQERDDGCNAHPTSRFLLGHDAEPQPQTHPEVSSANPTMGTRLVLLLPGRDKFFPTPFKHLPMAPSYGTGHSQEAEQKQEEKHLLHHPQRGPTMSMIPPYLPRLKEEKPLIRTL